MTDKQNPSFLRFVFIIGRKLSKISYRLSKFMIWYLQRKLIQIPIDIITDEFAFSLEPQGWNFYCSLMEDYERNPKINIESTQFFKFFQHERIKSSTYLNDLLFFNRTDKKLKNNEYRFYLGTWPWGGMTEIESLEGGTPFGIHYDHIEEKMTKDLWGSDRNLWYEPGNRYTLEFEMDLTIKTYNALKKGYRPLYYNSFPSVTLLIRLDGQKRALMYDGHHRLTALKVLGYKRVMVEVAHVVKETEVEDWCYVRNGYCTKEEALEIFNAFFELNGKERLIYLDLDN